MPLLEIVGDLFEAELAAIGHGCNTSGIMGAGIATEFKRRYPEMFQEYRRRCSAGEFRLGEVFVWEGTDRVIYNLATQPRPGPSATLGAIRESVSSALVDATRRSIEAVGVPRLGAGLGGLAWDDVLEVLDDVGSSSPVDLIVVSLPS